MKACGRSGGSWSPPWGYTSLSSSPRRPGNSREAVIRCRRNRCKTRKSASRVTGFRLAVKKSGPQKGHQAMEKLALLSVSDKRGLVEFATALVQQHGYRLLSTGGTAKLLAGAGLPVTE